MQLCPNETLLGASILPITFAELNETATSNRYDSEDLLSLINSFLQTYTSPKPSEHRHRNLRHQFQRTNFHPQTPYRLENFSLKTPAHGYHESEDTSSYNRKLEKTISFQADQLHKTYKEPQGVRNEAPINIHSHSIPHVPGHNINVHELNNIFFPNEYYPKNLNMLDKNHNRQANLYFEPRFSYKKESNTLPPGTKTTQKDSQLNTVLAHQYPQDVNKYNRNMQSIKNENLLQSKNHHKAVMGYAQVKNVAHAPHKGSLSVKSNYKKIRTLEHHHFSNSHDIKTNTNLLPVEKKNIYLNYYSV